jgi:hypothetical protein
VDVSFSGNNTVLGLGITETWPHKTKPIHPALASPIFQILLISATLGIGYPRRGRGIFAYRLLRI